MDQATPRLGQADAQSASHLSVEPMHEGLL